MNNCEPVRTPMPTASKLRHDSQSEVVNPTLYKSLVGSLRNPTLTRPNIMYVVGIVSRHMEEPKQEHYTAAKRILRYMQGSVNYGLHYTSSEDPRLVGYTDTDYGGDLDERKSTSAYMFTIGSAAFSWSSKKQPVVALISCEAEYIAAVSCACQAMWLRN